MPARRLACVLLVAALLSGCVVEMVERKKPRLGPVPEVGYVDVGGGEVRYSVEGWNWVIGLRRSAAFRRMRRLCKGQELRITNEFTRDDVDTPYSRDDMSQMARGVEHFEVKPHRHIVFLCEPKGKPYLKP